MDRNKVSAIAIAVLAAALVSCAGQKKIPTPVSLHGQLRVEGTRLVDAKGEPVQLKGPSLFDVVSYGEFANPKAMAWYRDDWKATVFRAAMYTEYNGAYVGTVGEDAMRRAIRAAVASGLYVLADWHILADADPRKYQDKAIAFFGSLAEEFGATPNIIYEICNEPNRADVDWAGAIKPYAEKVVAAIRAKDPDGVIIVGTPSWSSHPEIAAADPLPESNIMYTLHFYAGSHGRDYRDRIDAAMAAGAAVFVTEWGTTDSSGNGPLYPGSTLEWSDFLDSRGIPWCNWSLTTKQETSAELKPGANAEGGWAPGVLTESGALVRMLSRGEKSGIVFADDFESGNFQGGRWDSLEAGMATGKGKGRKSASAASLDAGKTLAKKTDLSPYSGFQARFSFKADKAPKGAKASLRWLDGGEWKEAASFPVSASWKTVTAALPAQAAAKEGGFAIAYLAENSGSPLMIDDVSLSAKVAASP
jgi:aryl-phospho-beta-D-glucosidase BglC (GH1 family)